MIKTAIISTALTVSVIWFAITIAAYHYGYRMGEDYGDCYRVGRGDVIFATLPVPGGTAEILVLRHTTLCRRSCFARNR